MRGCDNPHRNTTSQIPSAYVRALARTADSRGKRQSLVQHGEEHAEHAPDQDFGPHEIPHVHLVGRELPLGRHLRSVDRARGDRTGDEQRERHRYTSRQTQEHGPSHRHDVLPPLGNSGLWPELPLRRRPTHMGGCRRPVLGGGLGWMIHLQPSFGGLARGAAWSSTDWPFCVVRRDYNPLIATKEYPRARGRCPVAIRR